MIRVSTFLLLFMLSILSPSLCLSWPDYILRGANLGVRWGSNTEADISHFSLDWRGNSVRLLLNDIMPATYPYQVSEEYRESLFGLIDLCLKHQLYTVVSLSTSFDNYDNFFTNAQLKDAYRDFWVEVAMRYADNEGGIAYDLMNEPHGTLAQTEWSDYARELTTAIREVDSVHTIVVESTEWGWPKGFSYLKPTGDTNTVYSFHFYGPMDFTHQRNGSHMNTTESQWRDRVYPGTISGEYWDKEVMRIWLRDAINFRNRYDVRLYCGEFGCARWALGASQWFKDWIDLLEEEHIDWNYYSYREWHHMDLEMDPSERVNPTERSETELVGIIRDYFARNQVQRDFNKDGEFSIADIFSLIRFQISHPRILASDYNRDGKANILDTLTLLLNRGKEHNE